jgi:hypothetical protein
MIAAWAVELGGNEDGEDAGDHWADGKANSAIPAVAGGGEPLARSAAADYPSYPQCTTTVRQIGKRGIEGQSLAEDPLERPTFDVVRIRCQPFLSLHPAPEQYGPSPLP